MGINKNFLLFYMEKTMKYLHFVGIGGIGMSGLASWCRALGYKVSGSDRDAGKSENAHILSPLKAQGITIYPQDGSYANDGTPDALVFSSAIEEGNPDFKAGAGLPRLHRSQLLSQLVTGLSKQGIAVAGSCGKSTVTAFLSEALLHCGQDAGFLNGAISKRYISNSSIGNFHEGTGDFFIFEADESDKSLVNYAPDYAIVLNMGTDHYSKEELAQVFAAFLNRVKKGAVIEQDVYTAVKPFLNNPDLTIKVFSAVPSQEADHFLETYTITRGTDGALQPAACFNDGSRILLPAPGRHTAANALAIFALLEMLGIPPPQSAEGG